MENHVGGAAASPLGEAEKIPQDIQSVLPSDPFELLRISRALALQACAVRIQGLEDDNSRLQTSSDASIRELQGKVAALQASLEEANNKLSKAEEEQEKLVEEKSALVAMVKKLNRDVAKLETFKRTLMAQLQDEGDDTTSAVSVSSVKGAATTETGNSGASGASGAGAALRLAQSAKKPTDGPQKSGESSESEVRPTPSRSLFMRASFRTPSMTPSIFSPAYTPSATPPHTSSASPRVGGKPGRPRVDGKEFFRQARSRLSYEQFSTFLANIKELNAHKQTREETLKKAEDIFGTDNKDLYTQFESLLSRHLPS